MRKIIAITIAVIIVGYVSSLYAQLKRPLQKGDVLKEGRDYATITYNYGGKTRTWQVGVTYKHVVADVPDAKYFPHEDANYPVFRVKVVYEMDDFKIPERELPGEFTYREEPVTKKFTKTITKTITEKKIKRSVYKVKRATKKIEKAETIYMKGEKVYELEPIEEQ